MKATAPFRVAGGALSSVDLILFAQHMRETARTAAARRLFGEFLQAEFEHWREAQRRAAAAPAKGGSHDREG